MIQKSLLRIDAFPISFYGVAIYVFLLSPGCTQKVEPVSSSKDKVLVFDASLQEILDSMAVVETLAEGFTWSEGPLWLKETRKLLFTDVPANTIYSWDSLQGKQVYLFPSGLDSLHPTGGIEGANGLTLDAEGQLILCQHGNRAVARMVRDLSSPADTFTYLATHFRGKRLNSPNDVHLARDGDMYFTDPPYGLAKQDEDPAKELSFQGVYRLSKDGQLFLIDSTLSRPNGVALFPDEKTLLVSNSDPENAIWVAYSLDEQKNVTKRTIFANMTHKVSTHKGLPDGLKISRKGFIFASGPGGLLIFHPDGRHLGTINTNEATANCALDDTETWLYMTAHSFLKRIRIQ